MERTPGTNLTRVTMPKSLPSNANLGHLKKQAKQLLQACRNNQTEAKRRFIANHPYASGIKDATAVRLQEAQTVIAREYGIGSWPKLVEAVRGDALASDPDASGILLITNGAHAIKRLEAAGVPGLKVEWLEVLHDGPVPLTRSRRELKEIRARHFESLGWTSFEGAMSVFEKREQALQHPEDYTELQLWFEHDLFDQLQLIELLDYLSERRSGGPKRAWLSSTTFSDDWNSRNWPTGLQSCVRSPSAKSKPDDGHGRHCVNRPRTNCRLCSQRTLRPCPSCYLRFCDSAKSFQMSKAA